MADTFYFAFEFNNKKFSYENLAITELLAIAAYYCSGDTAYMDELLLNDSYRWVDNDWTLQLSIDARRFIADALAGRVKSKKMNNPSTSGRDYMIFSMVSTRLFYGDKLTANQPYKDSAVLKVVETLRLSHGIKVSESVVLKAYTDVKKERYEAEKIDHFGLSTFISYSAFKDFDIGVMENPKPVITATK